MPFYAGAVQYSVLNKFIPIKFCGALKFLTSAQFGNFQIKQAAKKTEATMRLRYKKKISV